MGVAVADSMARVRGSRRQSHSPVPPHEMLPARTLIVPRRGEFFLRDSGETDPARPAVMLLHGWMVTADLNWHGAYDALAAAGYRVLAVDHRGHGRGLRAMAPFRLEDCAADAAAILRELGVVPAVVVGYSMGVVGVLLGLATVCEVPIDHLEVTDRAEDYNPALISAVAAVTAPHGVPVG